MRRSTVVLLFFLGSLLSFLVIARISEEHERRCATEADVFLRQVGSQLAHDRRFKEIRLVSHNWGGRGRTIDVEGKIDSTGDVTSLKAILVSNVPPFDIQISVHAGDRGGLLVEWLPVGRAETQEKRGSSPSSNNEAHCSNEMTNAMASSTNAAPEK